MTCSITTGTTFELETPHSYVGVMCGTTEFRIYADRQGWFVDGSWTAIVPKGKGAHQIKMAVEAGGSAFLEFLEGKIQKWELKERAGI